MSRSVDVVVYGATGLTGRRACAELEAHGTSFAIAGRNAEALAALAHEFPAAEVRVAELTEPSDLGDAFADAKLVLSCAGPASTTNDGVTEAK